MWLRRITSVLHQSIWFGITAFSTHSKVTLISYGHHSDCQWASSSVPIRSCLFHAVSCTEYIHLCLNNRVISAEKWIWFPIIGISMATCKRALKYNLLKYFHRVAFVGLEIFCCLLITQCALKFWHNYLTKWESLARDNLHISQQQQWR